VVLVQHVAHQVEHDEGEIHEDEIDAGHHGPEGQPGRHQLEQLRSPQGEEEKEGAKAQIGQADAPNHPPQAGGAKGGPHAAGQGQHHDAGGHGQIHHPLGDKRGKAARQGAQPQGQAHDAKHAELLVAQGIAMGGIGPVVILRRQVPPGRLLQHPVGVAGQGQPGAEAGHRRNQQFEGLDHGQDQARPAADGEKEQIAQGPGRQGEEKETGQALPERGDGGGREGHGGSFPM